MLGYYICINIIGYFVMWLDKQKAKKRKYRISEKTLGLLALSFASLGMTIAMWQFRHKTQTWYFKYPLPLLTVIHLIIILTGG